MRAKSYTEDENEIIRRLFPETGTGGVQEYLPHRTIQSIQKQAGRLGVYRRSYEVRMCYATGPRPQREAHAPEWPANPGASLRQMIHSPIPYTLTPEGMAALK